MTFYQRASLAPITVVTVLTGTFGVSAATGKIVPAHQDEVSVATVQNLAFVPVSVNPTLTIPDAMMKANSITGSALMGARNPGSGGPSKSTEVRRPLPDMPPAFRAASNRLSLLALAKDDWKGLGSRAPTENALTDGLSFIRKLASLPGHSPVPGIGLDDEGYFTFSWSEKDRSGCVSLCGDGTYSFFIRHASSSFASDSEDLGNPLNPDLVKVLTL